MEDQTKQQLKRKRTNLENEIDQKLLSYSKLDFASAFSHSDDGSGMLSPREALEHDIETLLAQLDQTNDSIERMEDGSSTPSAVARQQNDHHRDKFVELQRDYRHTKQTLQRRRDREELLSDCHKITQEYSTNMTHLSNERASLMKSSAAAEEVLSAAERSRQRLAFQRGIFGNISGNLSTIVGHLPGVDNIISKIQRKKSRDAIVLSVVIAICLFIVWLYWK
eukprot:TRINITY_DN112570_c0_g1_i1.p1 TRINITY_DN112570_c0_g1~~TRINITY_DN112570_c0_g1_i1.p1  ORF type:complete len:235 (+),score=17.66 TRINITY_DN112570_c0_g1_i1:39-707(+)